MSGVQESGPAPAGFRAFSWVAGTFVVALAVRLLVSAQLQDLPLWRTPQLDSLEYLDWARQIAARGFDWRPYPSHAPGYPFFLAAVLAISQGSLPAVRVAQSLLGACSCLLTAFLASRTFSPRAGRLAGLLQAVYGPLVFLEASLLAEGLLIFLLLAALTAALLQTRAGTARWPAAGLLLGLAVIVRPTAAAALPALLYLWWQEGFNRKSLAAALLLAAAALPVVPVLLENARVTGSAMIQGYVGLNFYLGNSPARDGLASARLGADWERLNADAALHGHTRPSDQDRFYLRKALAEIREQPFSWVRLLGSKLLWLVQAEEVRDTHSFHFFRQASRALALLPGWSLVFPLAGVGLLSAFATGSTPAASRRSVQWLAVYLVSMALTGVGLVVGTRYRIPLVPVLIVCASQGALAIIDAWRARRRQALAIMAAGALAVLGLTQTRHHVASHNCSEEWTLTGNSLLEERDLAGAEAAYRRAVQADPLRDYAWDGLGQALYRLAQWDDARQAFGRVIALAPDSAQGYYHLGYLEEQQGRAELALTPLRRAVSIAPMNLDAWRALGRALLITGANREANEVFRRVIQSNPAAADAHFGLAWLANLEGRFPEGLAEARRATELQPGNGEAWLLLGRLALNAQDAVTAEAALARAKALVSPTSSDLAESLARLGKERAKTPLAGPDAVKGRQSGSLR